MFTGRYPFAENWQNVPTGMVAVPILVNFSKHELPELFRQAPPLMSAHMKTVEEFERYLSTGLGRKVILPRDDRPFQNRLDPAPHIYQYQYDGHNYFVACYLTKKLPHTNRLDKDLYKYEVGSMAVPYRNIRRFLDIPTDETHTMNQKERVKK